jgi:hypothetical protein
MRQVGDYNPSIPISENGERARPGRNSRTHSRVGALENSQLGGGDRTTNEENMHVRVWIRCTCYAGDLFGDLEMRLADRADRNRKSY